MEQNLCAFCQTIPLRERVYSDPVWETSYRTQEKDGKMILLSKRNFNDGWVPALTGYQRLDVGYKRTDTVPELPSITANASAGCHFCKLLLDSTFQDVCIEACKKNRDVSTVSISLIYDCKLHDDQFGLMDLVLRAVFDGGGDSYLASYRVVAEENDPCIKLLGIAERPPTIHCDERLPTMNRWINNCEGDCHPQSFNGDVPTRLLDVGSKDKIHLVECKKEDLSGWRYVALSHCWGPPDRPPIRTTKDSLDERCRHIPFESLPTNYQDAATVTQGLGLKYLWIDSLCIIQDSITDWEQESTRMHEVYRNAYFTIIAANGSSCHDGFLDLKPAPRVRLNYKSSTNTSSKGTYFLWKLHDIEEEIEESQWNRRGWTFQEQRSCDKNLYFTAHDFVYWCSKGFQSMQDPQKRHPWKTGRTSILDDCQLVQQMYQINHKFFDLFFKSWTSNVEAYSGRIFTNPKDRLPAFSAMAKLLSRSAGGRYEYLAGLWTENLHLWLLWRCKNPPPNYHLKDRLQHTTGSDFIAPSWSWASQSQSVFFDLLFHFRLGGSFCLVTARPPRG